MKSNQKKILYIALIVLVVSISGLWMIKKYTDRIREDGKKMDELKNFKYDPKKTIDPRYHKLFDHCKHL